ncbi:MAG: 3-deoxy-manno-octulosonate cytidylyltransferase [Deltaproteobacteria bacterium]|nr:3-deoxy-manno-octulosonate cytidylyltransferase [Deltaproteobacteria bacterium]
MGSRVVVIIPARYESTRLPGKPLAVIDGKPMIQRVYERARGIPGIDSVLVATDDQRIAAVIRDCGGAAVMTRSTHVSGTDRIAEAAAALDAEVIVNVQGDLPFLQPSMVADAVDLLRGDSAVPMATIKTPIRQRAEMENPNVVKVVTDRDGYAIYFSRSPIPFWRDTVPASVLGYKHLGVYAYRRDFLLTFTRLAPTPLEQAEKLEQLRALESGFRIKVAETAGGLGVEVDTPEDLERARAVVAG